MKIWVSCMKHVFNYKKYLAFITINFFSNICVMADVGGFSCHPWHFNEFQSLSQYIDELTVPLTIVLKSPKPACYEIVIAKMNLYWWSRVPSNLSPIYQMVPNKFIYRVLKHIYCRFINLSLICATQFLHALCKSLWKISQISIIVSQSPSLMMVHVWFPCIVFVLNVSLMFQTLHIFQNLFLKKTLESIIHQHSSSLHQKIYLQTYDQGLKRNHQHYIWFSYYWWTNFRSTSKLSIWFGSGSGLHLQF